MRAEKRLSELDTLRGIAALLVCLLHFGFCNFGITGLDLFFMISGFVIFMSISNSKSLKSFWIARFIRLFPIYILSIFIALFFCRICIVPSPISWNFVAGNLVMLQPVFKTTYFSIVYWTLYIEMMFYLFISVIWVIKMFKNMEWVLLIFLLLSLCLHSSYLLINSKSIERIYILTRGYLPLVSYFHIFASGIVFYLIYSKGLKLIHVLLLSLCLFLTCITHNISGNAMYFIGWPVRLLIVAGFYLAFFLIINHKARLLSSPYLTVTGAISYALYLEHSTFGIWVKEFFSGKIGLVFSSIIGIIASLILAFLITYFYDLPIRQRLKKLLLKEA